MYLVSHVKCLIFLPDLNKIWISLHIFINLISIKICRNPFTWTPVDIGKHADRRTDGWTDMTKVTGASCG